MEQPSHATAYQAWDRRWASDDGRQDWLVPEPDVRALLPQLRARGARQVLDLGCGIGRHALYLGAEGFAVSAIDASAAGLAHAAAEAARLGLTLDLRQGLMLRLPYSDGAFDFVLSWNVIYHGHPHEVAAVVNEIRRVLKPGGLYQGTMLTKRNARYGVGRLVAADTFVIDGEDEKDHPHFYCDAGGLAALFRGFEIMSLAQVEQREPGHWHWHMVAERAS